MRTNYYEEHIKYYLQKYDKSNKKSIYIYCKYYRVLYDIDAKNYMLSLLINFLSLYFDNCICQ